MGDRIEKFEDLEAWKQARGLVASVYKLTAEPELSRDFGLQSQLQRAAVSIMSNVAEGFERLSLPEKRQFYNIARASCGEVRSLSYVVGDVHPRLEPATQSLRMEIEKCGRLISGLIRSTAQRTQP
ncbi:MAG: four helix bundle protein [Verrucomicrobiaceae bacterium]